MQYDPIKKSLGRIFSGSVFLRKVFYFLLDILLLRTWHVKRALVRVTGQHKDNLNILDAGCGFGQYTWRMSRMNRSWIIKAVDIDDEHIRDCENFFDKAGLKSRVGFQTLDLTMLNEINRYDLILSVDVMEHIENDLLVFRNFHNALVNNGTLVISTPSDKGGSDVHEAGEDSFIGEHVRDGYGIDEITRKLHESGFSSVEAVYTYGMPGKISWVLSMKYPIMLLNVSKLFFIVLPFWYLIFYPLAFILNFLDLVIRHKEGTGLLVTATKQHI